MAHHFGLGEARQADLLPPLQPTKAGPMGRRFGQIDTANATTAKLKNQLLLVVKAMIT
jgi:hypothetical protein